MTLLDTVLPFLLILIVLIVVHELGHYITAKLFRVKVLEAGLGYPPRVWGFTWRDTIYSINALPLGGFVRLLGEEDPGDPDSLAAKPRWVRLIVLASGSGMNFLLPIFLFALAFMIPRQVAVGPAVISEVVTESPAAQAGLQTGDTILELNGERIKNVQEAGRLIRLNLGEEITFKVKRQAFGGGNEVLSLPVHARWAPPDLVYAVEPGDTTTTVADYLGVSAEAVMDAAGIKFTLDEGQVLAVQTDDGPVTYTVQRGDSVATVARRLGVSQEAVRLAADLPDPNQLTPGRTLRMDQGPTGIRIGNLYPFTESESFPPWEAIPKGWTATLDSLILARNQVISMFKGGSGPDVAGPVGIAQATGEVVKQAGWQTLLDFAALLSINLAIINILPLPMLDGGRIAFVLLEIARRGKRIAPEKEALVHFVGLALIITLAVVVTYFDVVRLIRGESLFR